MLLASLDQTIFATALPTIVGEFNGVQNLAWVTTAYLLASTTVLPLYGKAGDLFGRKGLFVAAITLFIAGSLIGGLAHDMASLITARAVQGLGGGGLIVLSQAIVADTVPARERGKYLGPIGALFVVASLTGPLLGGLLVQTVGWRWAFWINIPLGAVSVLLAAVFLRVPSPPKRDASLDLPGLGLAVATTVCLVLVGTWGGRQFSWSSPVILLLVAGAVASTTAFMIVERRVKDPVIPLAMFRNRNFTIVTVCGLLMGVIMFGAIGYLPTWLQFGAGLDPAAAGAFMIPLTLATLASSTASGLIVTTSGRYKWMLAVAATLVAVALLLLSSMTVDVSRVVVVASTVLLGLGLGVGMQLYLLIAQDAQPPRLLGTATSTNSYFRQVGAVLGSAVVGSVFSARLATGATAAGIVGVDRLTPASLDNLDPVTRATIASVYTEALAPVYLGLVPLAALAVILLIAVIETPLATHTDTQAKEGAA